MLQNKLCKLDLEMPSIGDIEHLILTMLCKPNVDVWMPLLGACRSHCNAKMVNMLQNKFWWVPFVVQGHCV